ncbi:hypothetical protein [Candidatus Sodalis pierantonius]|uniref:hypothetical protein n=1 Tax=Candidatus Sodalis pierantonii TaxID=1486991 RepID=UPI001F389325|nr:hypothetical protein [Candidatus Sodalis pierantonius]
MTVRLLSHIDVPPTHRPAFAAAGVTLYLAPRADHTGPLWPDGSLRPVPATAAQGSAEDELFDAAAIDVLLTIGSLGISAQEMDKLPTQRLICCLGVGYERVDLAAAAARGIRVTHGRGTNDTSVADHAMTLMLALVRDIAPLDRAARPVATVAAFASAAERQTGRDPGAGHNRRQHRRAVRARICHGGRLP